MEIRLVYQSGGTVEELDNQMVRLWFYSPPMTRADGIENAIDAYVRIVLPAALLTHGHCYIAILAED